MAAQCATSRSTLGISCSKAPYRLAIARFTFNTFCVKNVFKDFPNYHFTAKHISAHTESELIDTTSSSSFTSASTCRVFYIITLWPHSRAAHFTWLAAAFPLAVANSVFTASLEALAPAACFLLWCLFAFNSSPLFFRFVTAATKPFFLFQSVLLSSSTLKTSSLPNSKRFVAVRILPTFVLSVAFFAAKPGSVCNCSFLSYSSPSNATIFRLSSTTSATFSGAATF